uniref:7TM_GPCR_Srx domain-containing protein n=1 Tax=Heterorhabditis bacteriophora TaxID=37862 RepID=A0A1I7X4A2_HETBA
MAIGVTAYCCANCIIFILASAKASTMLMETLMFKTSDFSSYLYIAMTVFVFVHVYEVYIKQQKNDYYLNHIFSFIISYIIEINDISAEVKSIKLNFTTIYAMIRPF